MYFYDFPIIGVESSLPLYLISVGLNEWQYHVVCRDGDRYTKILYSTKGSGTLLLEGNRYIIKPFTIFVIPAGVPHEYFSNGDVWDTHWVIPSGYACADIMKQFGLDKIRIFPAEDIKRLEHIFRRIHETLSGDKQFGNYRASGYLYDFLIELYRIYSSTRKSAPTNPIVTMALDYIEINYRSQISLDDLCSASGVSGQHLCRLFRQILGCRPMEYIAKRRIQAAKELLASSQKRIDDIAEDVGFCDSSYFCKLFRRYEGITPAQFRKIPSRIRTVDI